MKKTKSKLLDLVRREIRTRPMSIRTEEAYCRWIVDFLRFHKGLAGQWRHSEELDSQDVNIFLSHLAVERNVAVSTQNQALSAIVFLYTQVLEQKLEIDATRAKRPAKLPVVLSVEEVRRVLSEIPLGPFRFMAG